MNEFEGTFEFFCRPTKTGDNKKTIVELTTKYDLDFFCKAEKFWDQKITVRIVKEEFKDSEKPKKYDFLVMDDKHNKGAKDIKTFTIFLGKLFDHDEHLELDEFLHQKVFITWNQLQPDIDFKKSEDPDLNFGKNENEIDDLEDLENDDD